MSVRIFAASFVVLLLAGCTTMNPFDNSQPLSNTAGGAIVGAGGGALAGALIGGATGNDPRVGALIGAGVGALTGAGVGAYMDHEEAELRDQLRSSGVSVTRAGNQIALNMPSNITFDTDKSVVKPQFNATLVAVGLVLKKYDQTVIDVYGYTDSQGSDAYNRDLSQRRAVAVGTVVANQGVDQRRFYIEGRGEHDPIASNATETGRGQNRRVEIQISPLTAG
jgi:outer membrane protein OmpA-like peptidoglycan-associated protein